VVQQKTLEIPGEHHKLVFGSGAAVLDFRGISHQTEAIS